MLFENIRDITSVCIYNRCNIKFTLKKKETFKEFFIFFILKNDVLHLLNQQSILYSSQ